MKLVKYEAARHALAAAHRVDEAKAIRDKSIALAAYARQAQDRDMIAWATEIKLRAERRGGELLLETANRKERQTVPERGSGPANTTPLPTLKTLGITRHQSSDWQKLAAIPEKEFEHRIIQAKGEPANLTTERILRPTPRKIEDPFEEERHVWAAVKEWLRDAAGLPELDELKGVRPTGGSAEALRKHFINAERYMKGLRRLADEGHI
jgi:hypothetical protein